MKRHSPTRRAQVVVALLCLAALIAACAGQSPTPSLTDEGQAGIETEPAAADQSPVSESASPLPAEQSPLPADTPAMSDKPAPDPTSTGADAQQGLDLPNIGDDSPLPIFVEMVQAPLSPDLSPRMPPADSNPSGVYLFNPGDRTLILPLSFQVLPTTEVLVGLSSASVPGKPYFASDLFQIPCADPVPIHVMAIDTDTGVLTLAYAGQTFELDPGRSKSFKQGGGEEPAILLLTTITNYGRLERVGPLLPDPGSP